MGKISRSRVLDEVQASASQRIMKTSPQKLNLVAGLIRGKRVADALSILHFSQKRIAGDVRKVLYAAISNAENNHSLDIDNLFVDEAYVGKSMTLKRFRVRGRGRVAPVKKHFSNLKIIVGERELA